MYQVNPRATLNVVTVMRTFLGAMTLVLLAACGGGAEQDLTACEDAMRAQFEAAMTDPDAEEGTRPSECAGVSDADLERIATKILEEAFE